MIVKLFEINKIKTSQYNFYLFYGENEGLKNQTIYDYFYKKFNKSREKYEESEVLNNYENFISNLLNRSLFQEEKLIIISRISEKILKLIEELIDRNINDVTLILNSGILEKKSKLRKFFEKEKKLVCIPFYIDDTKTLSILANNFFKSKKIQVSQETIDLIVQRCRGDRQNLNNELEKILNFMLNKKQINVDEILKLTNLAENYSVSELVDNCLSKNLKKTINVLNENNYSSEDCILILRTMLLRAKRLLKLREEFEQKKSAEIVINSYKPPIFWKDKEIVKKQVLSWSKEDAQDLIYEINDIEILLKKNAEKSLNIISDFILKNVAMSNSSTL